MFLFISKIMAENKIAVGILCIVLSIQIENSADMEEDNDVCEK